MRCVPPLSKCALDTRLFSLRFNVSPSPRSTRKIAGREFFEQLEEKELPSGGAKIVFTESSSDVLRKIYHRCPH